MPFVTDSAPITYNGYTFPVGVQTVQFDQEPVFDESDRTIMYVRYRVGLQFPVCEEVGDNIDSTMATVRQTLMQRGGVFDYSDRGFGSDFIVGPGDLEDVHGGPRPVAFSIKPKGKNRGLVATWTVELCLPSQCTYSPFGTLMTVGFKIKFHINQHGYTTITYTGFGQIPKIVDYESISNADQFIDELVPDLPVKFKRLDRDYDYNWDKTRIDISVVDEEMTDQCLPAGCSDASASHEVGSDTARGFLEWDGNITGRYTIAPPYSIEVGWKAFKDLVKERLDVITANLDDGTFNGQQKLEEQKPGQKARVMLTSIRMSEPAIYKSTDVQFSVTYKQIATLKALIGDTQIGAGLWRYPINGSDAWQAWAASMPTVLRNKAIAQLQLNPADEVIVDLCTRHTPRPPEQEATFGGGDIGINIGSITDLQPDPDVDTSWFNYEPEVEILEDQHAIVSSALTDTPFQYPYDLSPGDLTAQGYVPDAKPSDETDTVQYRAPATLFIHLAGQALRAWFPIPRPKVVSWAGFEMKEVSTQDQGCYWRSKTVANLGIGVPIYYAKWRFKYAVTARPASPIRPPTSLSEQN